LPQFYKTYKFDYNLVKSGLLLMVFGLFKKMVIADRAALYVNEVYNNVDGYSGVEYFYATVFFAVQIYCDFSGYSDIAIGAARTMGFDLMKNFNSPYFSKSLTEFWRRWHISLSTWFRDYVFIPLGGSRKGKIKTYFNLFIVFVISGLWHGAAITFIIWGAIHGIILIFEKASFKYKKQVFNTIGLQKKSPFSNFFFGLITFFIVCLAWVFFRANSLDNAVTIINGIFTRFNFEDLFIKDTYLIGFKPNEFKILIGSILIVAIAEILHKKNSLINRINGKGIAFRWGFYFLLLFYIIIFGKYGDDIVKEFIYFQF
jgi:alginate O-acetyltransferase complex protein AlgI